MRKLLLFTCIFAVGSAFAHSSNPPTEPYLSGSILARRFCDLIKKESGITIQVPVDYSNPKKGTTNLYFATPHGFDPKKRSLVYFIGGPGGPCHDVETETKWLASSGFNVIVFDQRGIAFSRPEFEVQYRSPGFYSSESTARDADEIRRHLKIKKWTVVGGSYGTVPATIYGHLFPDNTRAAVLMGTVVGSIDWLSRRQKIMTFALRHPNLQDLLVQLGDKAPDQASKFAEDLETALMEDGLSGLTSLKGEWRRKLAAGGAQPVQVGKAPDPKRPIMELDANVLRLVNERERIRNYKAIKGYLAEDYPVTIPITYIQGTMDPRTTAGEAVLHFKNVAQGIAQMIFVVGGGHTMPTSKVSGKVLRMALNGQRVSQRDIGCEPSLVAVSRP